MSDGQNVPGGEPDAEQSVAPPPEGENLPAGETGTEPVVPMKDMDQDAPAGESAAKWSETSQDRDPSLPGNETGAIPTTPSAEEEQGTAAGQANAGLEAMPDDEALSPADMEAEGEPDAMLVGESQEPVSREATPVPAATPQGDAQGTTPGEDEVQAEAQPAEDSLPPSNPQPAASAARASTAGKVNAAAPPLEPGVMPLMEHLKELRGRLVWSVGALLVTTALSFIFAKQVLVFLIAPMGDSIPQALKPTESLGNYMKVALICGVTLAMPMLVYQIGRFLAPGLTKQEKRWLILLVPGATICFVVGVAFAYFVMLPTAIPFLQGFMSDIIEQSWAIGEYLSFVTSLLLWIGLAFELPLFVFFLAKLGLVNADMLKKNRKYAFLGIAVIAAVITPTVDPVNMLLVMAPLVLLYELGIILAKIA